MGKTSSTVKNRYNAKVYDQIPLRIPKGRKALVDQFARERGESVNGWINKLIREAIGVSEEDWKKRE